MTEIPPPGRSSSVARRMSRKPHKKSRNGCENCKKRRIKCLEERPECSNCVKHSIPCSFTAPSPPSQPSSRETSHHHGTFHGAIPISASPRIEPFHSSEGPHGPSAAPAMVTNSSTEAPETFPPTRTLNIPDLELLHNYNTSTSYTLANVPELQNFLRVNVPRIALSDPFLMHGLLAISALHLAHFKKGESQAIYVSQAHEHYHAGMRIAHPLLRYMNEEQCPAMYIFTMISTFFALATGPQPGDYFLLSERGLPDWLVLFRGIRPLLQNHYHHLQNGVMGPLLQLSARLSHLPLAKIERLEELRENLLTIPVDNPDRYHCLTALDELEKCFPAPAIGAARAAQPSPQVAFMWTHQISDEFVESLQAKKPYALVVLAQFCVLLHDLSSFWWMRGWAEHLLSEVYHSLDEQHRTWLRWPMEEIGWLPG